MYNKGSEISKMYLLFIVVFLMIVLLLPKQVLAEDTLIKDNNNSNITITDIKEKELKTTIGVKPELPSVVEVQYSNNKVENIAVDWDEFKPEKYSKAGEFYVTGTIKPLEYPTPLIEERADPYIYRHTDGYYYFTGSVPEYDRIVLRRAKTIEGLINAPETVLWEKHSSGKMSKHIWAPEIHYIDGNWYIYFAAGREEDIWAIRPYVLECKDENPLNGKWEEKGEIKMNFKSFSLDATSFEHKGERYIVWAQKVDNDRVSNLYIDRLKKPWSIEGNQVLIAEPEYDWERIGFYVNEGPAVIKRNGRIFLAYSASATDDNYCMGLLTADADSNLLDPSSWKKNPQPVFTSNDKTSQYGPGHNSFTVAEDGKTDLFVYHARPYKDIIGNPLYDPNRHARVQRLFWNSDGTPNFGIPGYKIDNSIKAVVKIIVE